MDASTRFWRFVAKSDGCWIWRGCKNKKGYGVLHNKDGERQAHRFSYAEANGPIPDGIQVCHRCDNPACVRPSHLFGGTPADNSRDMHVKGRSLPGQHRYNAKLTPGQVRLIREDERTQRLIAAAFGISQSNVSRIKNNHGYWNVG